jgi:hypothetical protein
MATHQGSSPTGISADFLFLSPATSNTETESLSGFTLQTNLSSLVIAIGLDRVGAGLGSSELRSEFRAPADGSEAHTPAASAHGSTKKRIHFLVVATGRLLSRKPAHGEASLAAALLYRSNLEALCDWNGCTPTTATGQAQSWNKFPGTRRIPAGRIMGGRVDKTSSAIVFWFTHSWG